jgi:hypothetical protein
VSRRAYRTHKKAPRWRGWNLSNGPIHGPLAVPVARFGLALSLLLPPMEARGSLYRFNLILIQFDGDLALHGLD